LETDTLPVNLVDLPAGATARHTAE